MPINRDITDFFKPFMTPRPKRAADELYEDISAEQSDPKRRIGTSPHLKERHVNIAIRNEHESTKRATPTPPQRGTPEATSKPTSRDSAGSPAPPSSSLASVSSGTTASQSLPTLPTPEAAANGEVQNTLNTSFSSLSSLPPSSQITSSSSRRVIHHGLIAVKSSDSEDEDSDSSLEDLDEMIVRSRTTLPSPPETTPRTNTPIAMKYQLRNRDGRSSGAARSTLQLPSPPETKYKFSLNSLVAQSKKHTVAEARITKAKALLELSDGTDTPELDDAGVVRDGSGANDMEVRLTAAVSGDGQEDDTAQRVLQAVKRTEGLLQEKVWHLFNEGERNERSWEPFPRDSLSMAGWTTVLKGESNFPGFNSHLLTQIAEPQARQQAFLSGFTRDMIAFEVLPDEVVSWILHELCFESKDDLNHAYIATLEESPEQVKKLLNPETLGQLLRTLGAKEQTISREERGDLKLTPMAWNPNTEAAIGIEVDSPPAVSRCSQVGDDSTHEELALTLAIKTSLSSESRNHGLTTCLCISFDHAILESASLQNSTQDAIAALVASIPASELESALFTTSRTIFYALTSTSLRALLLHSLPDFSPPLNTLKRRLALAFFFDSATYLTHPLHDPQLAGGIVAHLRTPAFAVNDRTDFAALRATVSILDTAVASGFSDLSFSAPFPSSSSTTEAAEKEKEKEKAFNADIDALTTALAALSNRIVGFGTAHLKRTEAKAVLDRLVYRLSYAVRTSRRRKSGVFGGGGGGGGGGGFGGVDGALVPAIVTPAAASSSTRMAHIHKSFGKHLLPSRTIFVHDGVGAGAEKEKEKEKAFNADIDALATALAALSNRIVGFGTAHLKRTEAKAVLDRLVYRLSYAVRTSRRRKSGVFGRGGGGGGFGGVDGALEKFLLR
ncbi:hypothetical protein B0A49_00965 [Cryomyces minteri]|uniref:Uncharacterized protein n=1 Tax=Cryomyces minteri TaxID=331657 RepID=A0A4U0XV05_9PEZI|nr:hypothetical protein B0A49_00965 [Cryomyces minteri]